MGNDGKVKRAHPRSDATPMRDTEARDEHAKRAGRIPPLASSPPGERSREDDHEGRKMPHPCADSPCHHHHPLPQFTSIRGVSTQGSRGDLTPGTDPSRTTGTVR